MTNADIAKLRESIVTSKTPNDSSATTALTAGVEHGDGDRCDRPGIERTQVGRAVADSNKEIFYRRERRERRCGKKLLDPA